MDGPPPPDLDGLNLADGLARWWALEVGPLHYLPKGLGSYHWWAETPEQKYFVTVDDLDIKPWLGGSRDSTFAGLEAAYGAALTLHRQGRLRFVVAPIPGDGGLTTVRLNDRYALTVSPFINGQAGVWGDPITRTDRAHLLRHLAELHRSTAAGADHVRRHGLALPGRGGLDEAVDGVGRPWTGGPFSERARRAFVEHGALIRQMLVSFDHLAGQVQKEGYQPVITHGEPHPGNVIHGADGVHLVDWDTVGLSVPERDLWMLDDGSLGALDPYVKESGRSVNATALSLFRLSWTLSDLAAYTAMFRSDHGDNEGTEKSWHALVATLQGATSTSPYGPTPAQEV